MGWLRDGVSWRRRVDVTGKEVNGGTPDSGKEGVMKGVILVVLWRPPRLWWRIRAGRKGKRKVGRR